MSLLPRQVCIDEDIIQEVCHGQGGAEAGHGGYIEWLKYRTWLENQPPGDYEPALAVSVSVIETSAF